MVGAHEDPGLAEVKAILMKLQRIDPAAELAPGQTISDEADTSARLARAAMPAETAIKIFERKHAAITAVKPNISKRVSYLLGAGALTAGAAILLASGIVSVRGGLKSGAPKPETAVLTQQKESETALLAEARRFLSEGDVALARNRLLRAEPERHAAVAFMLAQSYDPNYLLALPKANGAPDRFEAERWYKRWHELAVQSGLEMDSGRLQRIINAMR
jgi:hypothetical protein